MARINNLTKYPYDYNITENDFVIGTDGDNKKTKNFPVVALAEYVRSSNNLSYDRIISIGEVTSEDNNITINVSDLGNVVYINEKFYTKNTPDVFTFTPVTEGVKIILLYALPDEQVFYMIEGVESNEAVEPDLPSGALFVQRIIVTVNGVEIIPNSVIISDNKVQITEETPFANIGQSQKEFNKNISDKLISLTDSTEVTKTELDVLISENKLEPNRLYKITGVESWCFSQHLIKAIYLKAITNNTLESEGVGEFYTPKYNTSDSNLGIWKGELLANGMISSASYNIGDKVIWGNLFWENISGNIGTNEKDYYDEENDESFFVKSQNLISETDWQLITPNDDESLYNIQFDSIKYDFQNDYINYRADNLGNVYEISYSTLLDYFPNNGIRYFAPEFVYNINSIALFQWGRGNTSNNIINESIVLNCNYAVYLFQKNIITENSKIFDNNFLNVSIARNTFKNVSIINNYLKSYGGILYNDLDNSYISSNRYYFEISYNKLKNYSSITNNNDNNIIVNINYSIIRGNSLDNYSTISNNIFVEEGKGVSGYKKGIYDNILTTYCNINSNTIKNGSRIFGHRLEYYSTINSNALDTDSNIYNNQLVQNGKIDNNILTGHGRIYGNQLDRLSEITNCKLRISPATSYATTMKNNRLFAGKIQNVDFGDIVNPVGTNPNDPNFGGNGLSECIIENESIIKDLTFPNRGGIGLQFIKMNGYSEFKNITINDSIKNVDFINTIFNETSDYSKLIEGSGYQTNGFTKTYIDGVLLQDKFNAETLDVITDRGNTTSNEITVGGINTDYVQLDTTSANVYDVGKIYWNGTKGTYNFGLKNNVELQLGQEQNVYGKAYSAITNGQLVMYRTSQGGHILFEPANFTQLSTNPDLIIGVATQDIALNEFGYITTFGEVNTLNTSSFADGNTLYFGSGNVLQNTVPSGSYFIVGRVNRSHATQGSIFVKPYFVDSNLVPYTGATKDVNISDYFYKTSKGFELAKDLDNYFKTYYYGYYNILDFKSKDSSDDNFGYLQITANAEDGFNVDCVDGNGATANSLQVNINGTSSPKAFVSGGGFKTPFGTPNQTLTADGGTFDLNTKADLVGGKVPSSQLPSYVDDVLEFANLASFPATGESGKIYIALDTNITYRWTGTGYAEISASLALGETSNTAYRGDRGKIAYDHSQVTHDKTLVGLGNVDNTSDLNKPISNATQIALNLKLSTEAPSTTGTVISFSTDKVYGTLTTPETGNITTDITNAKLGVTNIIIHNSGTAPTFGSAFKKLSGSGNYVTGVVNYIYCTYISTTEIIYSINQRT